LTVSVGTVEHLGELACLLCGHEIGKVTVPRIGAHVMIPSGLRCGRCGGRPIIGDVVTVSTYPKLPPIQPLRVPAENRRELSCATGRT
jgi:hypothetical protein